MATERATHGFWKGFLTASCWRRRGSPRWRGSYPPRPLMAPEIGDGALEAPAAPGQPQGAAEPEAPRSEALLPPAPAKPLIADAPAPDAAPDGGGAGSPSLMPKATP